MARMIPPHAPVGSENEHLVYEILKDCPSTEDWVILHQLDLKKHISQAMGEADLIVCVPEVAIVFLEVKGYVTFVDGEWFFGSDPEPKHSPFKQAQGAMFSIKDWIDEEAIELVGMPLVFGSIFAQTKWTTELPDFVPHQLIDSTNVDARNPGALRDAVLTLAKEEVAALGRLPRPVRFSVGEPSTERIERFVDLLRPSVHPPRAIVSAVWSRVQRFTSEQFAALDECKSHEHVVFKGLAGTGKTVLATEFAIGESERGNKVLFVCFTQLAREKLLLGSKGSPGFSIRGVVDLALETISLSAGEEVRKDVTNRLHKGLADPLEVLTQAISGLDSIPDSRKFDLLIVDEGQDVMAEEFLAVLNGWLKGGWECGKWAIFIDQNQWIFNSRRLDLKEFLDRFQNCRVRSLLANCRNTESIAMFANAHAKLTEPEWYDRLLVKHRAEHDHPTPSFRFYADEDDQDRLVTAHVFALIDGGIPPGEIVLLSGSKQSCAARIRAKGLDSLIVPFNLRENEKIRFETTHRFKGLESFCVVLTDVNELPSPTSMKPIRELLYTAITRAVFRLDCFASHDLEAQLGAVGSAL